MNDPENRLGLTDEAISDLAIRMAEHLRVELGDRLKPLQHAYEANRRTPPHRPADLGEITSPTIMDATTA